LGIPLVVPSNGEIVGVVVVVVVVYPQQPSM
jgi:hypothetical protein